LLEFFYLLFDVSAAGLDFGLHLDKNLLDSAYGRLFGGTDMGLRAEVEMSLP
jgi:hypothetical protein